MIVINRYKRHLLVIAGLMLSVCAYAQTPLTRADSVGASKLASQAKVSSLTGRKLYQALSYRKDEVAAMVSDTSIKRSVALSGLAFIMAERQRKIDSLLTRDERSRFYLLRDSLKVRYTAVDSVASRQQDERMNQVNHVRIKVSGN